MLQRVAGVGTVGSDRGEVYEARDRRFAESKFEHAIGALDVPLPGERVILVYLADLPRGVNDDVRFFCAHFLYPTLVRRIGLDVEELRLLRNHLRKRLLIEAYNLLYVLALRKMLHKHGAHVACGTGDENSMLHIIHSTLPGTHAEQHAFQRLERNDDVETQRAVLEIIEVVRE